MDKKWVFFGGYGWLGERGWILLLSQTQLEDYSRHRIALFKHGLSLGLTDAVIKQHCSLVLLYTILILKPKLAL